MEEWSHWEPIEGMRGRFFIQDFRMHNSGLLIELLLPEKNTKIQILFIPGAEAYRCTNESWCFDVFADLGNRYGDDFYVNRSFFEIKNSDYAKSLSLTSCGTSNFTRFRHFCIVGDDEMIDILATYDPEVKIIS